METIIRAVIVITVTLLFVYLSHLQYKARLALHDKQDKSELWRVRR